jgi:hypothetical protein
VTIPSTRRLVLAGLWLVLVVAIWTAVVANAPLVLTATPTDGPLSSIQPPDGYWTQAEIPAAFPLVVSTLGATVSVGTVVGLDRARRRLTARRHRPAD